jgi:DNA-binding transcriptional LysR family regulator
MIAEHLRDGRLIAPFPKRYDSARGYFALLAPRATDRDEANAFLDWLAEEAARETTVVAAARKRRGGVRNHREAAR